MLFEISVLAFREIIVKRLWKNDHRFQTEADFCKFQWDISKPRRTLLIECADLLKELSTISIRPCSEEVCKALVQAAVSLQPSALERTSLAPELWKRLLKAWANYQGVKLTDLTSAEGMSANFVSIVLLAEPTSKSSTKLVAATPQSALTNREHGLTPVPHQSPAGTALSQKHTLPQDVSTTDPRQPANMIPGTQTLLLQQPQPFPQPLSHSVATTGHRPTNLSSSGSNTQATQPSSNVAHSTSAMPDLQTEPYRQRIAHLLTDERRFHAPLAVLERVHRFFNGPPQLDPAGFEGSTLEATISIPFPDIMDTDGWRVPVTFNNESTTSAQNFAPIQSCFMHVPILPSKRRYETDTEVILLDDVRLAGQLNAKLWEEFSNGNIEEAISLIPTSATWFGKTELADWPCVVMTGLKFELANGNDPSGKISSEVHSYIVVYLGRDPIRQAQFVQTFQDLGISPAQNPDAMMTGTSSVAAGPSQPAGSQHRWIAGFRRLFRTQGPSSISTAATPGHAVGEQWDLSLEGDIDSIDPQFDDIYSIRPPAKKPRLERMGRPSDAQAAWHHNKRRKVEEVGYSKLTDQGLEDRQWDSDAEMSEPNVDDYTSGSDSDYTKYWIDWFLGTKGNEYFCEVDEEYILDRFNLTGLNTEVQYYSQALDLITDNLDENLDEEMRDIVEKSARHLYGLIHARFIITTHGLTKMLEKFKKCDFGRCPRVLCHNHPLLPVALSDVPYTKSVKLFCCRCEDIYNPKSTRHASIDGAYFGCSFPHMLFQVYPQLVPPKSTDRYVPRIFGFKLHDVAKQHRYQDMIREEGHARIMAGIEGLPATAAPGTSRDGQQHNHRSKTDGSASVTESGAMADVNN
ncbi:casein kinase 2 regulatory subunit [Dissophora globulifera]|uniref:Casein kinase II subunit beta n=1 Tax=Dissophora globulifera TaxID=979702 RepID=A0A9P6UNT3_9FUNG|nr:casein kinase 2 regulatory subunit [Dissophora globulifera]